MAAGAVEAVSMAEYLGIDHRSVDGTMTGGSSFEFHVQHAAAAIRDGLCDTVLVSYSSVGLAPGALDRAFFEAAARGELRYQRCPTCGHRQFYPRLLCTACGGDVEWAVASGRGVVHTYTIVRQNGQRPFRDELPYAVAIVELAEGERMMGNLTGCPVDPCGSGCRSRPTRSTAATGWPCPSGARRARSSARRAPSLRS